MILLPKDGGAIRNNGEKLAAKSVVETRSTTVPIFANPSRTGDSSSMRG
jgi:hypothetical protein